MRYNAVINISPLYYHDDTDSIELTFPINHIHDVLRRIIGGIIINADELTVGQLSIYYTTIRKGILKNNLRNIRWLDVRFIDCDWWNLGSVLHGTFDELHLHMSSNTEEYIKLLSAMPLKTLEIMTESRNPSDVQIPPMPILTDLSVTGFTLPDEGMSNEYSMISSINPFTNNLVFLNLKGIVVHTNVMKYVGTLRKLSVLSLINVRYTTGGEDGIWNLRDIEHLNLKMLAIVNMDRLDGLDYIPSSLVCLSINGDMGGDISLMINTVSKMKDLKYLEVISDIENVETVEKLPYSRLKGMHIASTVNSYVADVLRTEYPEKYYGNMIRIDSSEEFTQRLISEEMFHE